MAIILTKNIDGSVPDNFKGAVKDRVTFNRRSFDFVYIVPTRRGVRELHRELIHDVSFGKLPVYTLELFALEIYSFVKIRRPLITPSMQGMLIGRILSDDNFNFFRYSSSRNTPAGTIKKIVDQIDYLRENGILAADYERMLLAADNFERRKLEEFLQIYEKYEMRLDDGLIDAAGLLSIVNYEIAKSPEVLLNLVEVSKHDRGTRFTFFVEGFYNFKKPELEFLSILSSRKDFSFIIKLDCDDTNENLFSAMIETASELTARGFRKTVNSNKEMVSGNHDDGNEENLREYFAMNLFSEKRSSSKLDLKEKIFVVRVQNKLREVEFVAEKIKEIIKKNPAQKLDSICVASYLPQNYSQLIREVFTKCQIPANVTDRYTLDDNNVVNAILSFIDIRLTDYERGALLRAITNPVLTISDDVSASEAWSVLYHTTVLCRFERGFKNFRESIATHLRFLNKIAEGEESDGSIEESEIYRQTRILARADRILNRIEEKLRPFKKEITADEFRSAVEFLVSNSNIYENIARMNVNGVFTEVVERDAHALSAFFKVLDEVVEVEKKNVKRNNSMDPESSEALSLDAMVENLRAALALTRYNVRQKHGYGVYVTSLEEMRGLEFHYVFIVGLNEGELPTRYTPDIFLPFVSQKENRKRQPYLQRHLFYQAISSFKKNLFLISAEQTDDVHLVRSSFIDEVVGTIEPTFINEGEAGLLNIYNVQQLIERYPISTCPPPASRFLPPNVSRCISAEVERYRNNKESEFHGRINRPDLTDSLKRSLNDRIFSSAQIESMSRCGFQFFVRRVLQIAETPDVETSLSAIERGAVLHKILFQFYDGLFHKGKPTNAIHHLPLLLEIGQKVLDDLGIEHELFEVEKETILGNGKVKGTLELFLAKVQTKLSEYGFHPAKFEVGFGMTERVPLQEGGTEEIPALQIGSVAVRGKIDRIDSYSNPDGTVGLSVFDYKTSSAIAGHKDVVGDRISPQLLIYLSALSKMAHHGEPTGAAFISINRDNLIRSEDGTDLVRFIVQTENGELRYNPTFGSKVNTPAAEMYPKNMAELLNQTESFVEEKMSEARAGWFNLTTFPRERVCRFCSYSEACRIALRGESFQKEGAA